MNMSFEGIQGFLFRYRQYLSGRDEKRQKISEIISRISGVSVAEDCISLTRGELRIRGDSVLKNELFLHRNRILEELHKSGFMDVSEIY